MTLSRIEGATEEVFRRMRNAYLSEKLRLEESTKERNKRAREEYSRAMNSEDPDAIPLYINKWGIEEFDRQTGYSIAIEKRRRSGGIR